MRKGFLSSMCIMLAGAGWALGQTPPMPTAGPEHPAPAVTGSPGLDAFPIDQVIPAPPMMAPPGPPYMPMPPGPPPEGPPGAVKWLRTNAFGPRFTPFSARNAFGPHQTLPEELQDNVFCSTPPCDCCRDPRVWFSAEYIFLVLRNEPLPGPTTVFTPSTLMGFVPDFDPASTQIVKDELAGDGTFHNGGRFTAGASLTKQHILGIEASVFFTDHQGDGLGAGSDTVGNPLITPPIDNALLGQPGTFLQVADPDRLSGHVSEAFTTDFWGAEADLLFNPMGKGYQSLFLGGYRYLELRDTFTYNQSTNVLADNVAFFRGAAVPANSFFVISERYATKNQFHGGTFGLRLQSNLDRLFFNLSAKVGVGQNRQVIDVEGQTTFVPRTDPFLNPAGATPGVTTIGGVMATRSNIGRFINHEFSVVPEVGVNLGCHLTGNIHVFGGYNFLYWTKVLRPAGVVNTVGNPAQVPSSALFQPPPMPPFEPNTTAMRQSDFWAQGFNFGFAIDY